MSASEQDWRQEQERVDHVVDEIGKRMVELEHQVGEIKADIVEIRTNFWTDVTVNFDDAHEAAETYASIKQQAEVLSERERSHRHAHNQLKTLIKLKQSPYFGRIDFREEGEDRTDVIYLGIGSFMDKDGEHFLVYDWRAPVSSLYYDYSPGPAEYQTPGGLIQGEMELKRQYIIRDGEIRSLFDTGVTVGDELLQQVLGRHSDAQMKSIVATIQKEQNQIIRDERNQLLVVQGAAGSGKTSAALQRVAYLLYRYRESLRADHIVLFSPNQMFNSYVATVLPELGEENMQQTTFQRYLEHRLAEVFTLEDPFEQMEYTLTAMEQPGYEARVAGIRYKATTDFMHVTEKYIEHLGRQGMIFKDIIFQEATLISADEIQEYFYKLDDTLLIPNRMQLVSEWLLDRLKTLGRRERKKHWVEQEIELLDRDSYIDAYQQLQKKKRFTEDTFDDYEREHKFLGALVINEHFKPLRRMVRKLGFIDVPAVYRQLFSEPDYVHRVAPDAVLPEQWTEICAQTVEKLDRMELAYEDATPYLYIKERIEGFQTNTVVRHIFIDEAQDYSAFQFTFIKRLFPFAKFTVLGDLNQAIFAHAVGRKPGEDGFGTLLSYYKPQETKTVILRRSYRSTRQIIEFTSKMIPGGGEIEPFNREGDEPTVTQVSDFDELHGKVAERIRQLHEAGHQTLAVICKTAAESKEAYEALRNMPGVAVQQPSFRLVHTESGSFESGTVVIPAYLAKGVEFDAVIIYNGSHNQYGRESERKLFYTACTRAMHELHIYTVGKKSPFIV
ncbi:RNA polymerase recycling motor HelD [Brevibacillus dissolubilis]|uniref:RNA polymerase recycling motor HelD n=1 Tax=Brevibacillus dissolubilis TaxID=1844116 RepID=UPI0011162E2B|nr:RNA polymerase recycling motor HelD [Brevibacillus dissolubilis]